MTSTDAAASLASRLADVPLEALSIDPINPRQHVGDISELAASIRDIGLLNPLIVRPTADETYGVLCGQRRWHAAKALGLPTVPCIVRHPADDIEALTIAVADQVGRRAVNPMEEAHSYRALVDGGLQQQQVADRCSVSATRVSHYLALLELDLDDQRDIRDGRMPVSKGYAKAKAARNGGRKLKPRGRPGNRARPAPTPAPAPLSERRCDHMTPNGHQLVPLPTRLHELLEEARRTLAPGIDRHTFLARVLEPSLMRLTGKARA